MSNQINYEIEFYKKVGDERSPVDDYLDTMPEKHRQKAMAIMARLEEEGPNLKRPHADTLRGRFESFVVDSTLSNTDFYISSGIKLLSLPTDS